jgi:hypothetical protein
VRLNLEYPIFGGRGGSEGIPGGGHGPHFDYQDPQGGRWRAFPDKGMMEPVMSYLLLGEKQRAAAVDYMMQQLGRGKTLAKLLLETVDFERGTVAILNVVQLSETQMRELS